MKMLIAFILFVLSVPVVEAQTFPICRREAEVVRYKALARTLTNDEASAIVNLQGRVYQLRKARRNEARVGCNCDNTNPGLKSLIAFIEDDFSHVTNQILAQTTAQEEAAAQTARTNAFVACQARERRHNLWLLRQSELAYGPTPAGTQAMDGFNVEGVRGFIRTETTADGKRVKTFAFAGSQTLFDWWTNATSRGGSQLKRAMTRHLDAAVAWVKGGGHINCTGHSLGGGVAEGFCAAVLRKIRYEINDFGDFQKDNRIKIATFNGLGARDAYRNAMGTHDLPTSRDSWLTSNSIHYRVAGDPLASHVGTPHLMGTVIEKRNTRQVTKLGSNEATGFMNGVRALGSTVGNLLNGTNNSAEVRAAQMCDVSDNPLAAHDIGACREIASTQTGWRISQEDTVLVRPDV